MRLVLIRHGDAHAGFRGVVGGVRGCTGLTELGRLQATRLRDHLASTRRLRPDVLISSVLPRAIETARLVGPGVGLELTSQRADLSEVEPGDADGLAWADHLARNGRFDMEEEPDRLFAPAGESWNAFLERVDQTLQRLVTEHRDQTVMAVCHAGVIMASMRILLGAPRSGPVARLRPTNTGLTEWSYDSASTRWTLRAYDDTAHLVGVTPPTRENHGYANRTVRTTI